MTHLDIELKKLKKDMAEMFGLVYSQLEKSRQALVVLRRHCMDHSARLRKSGRHVATTFHHLTAASTD